MTRIIFGMSVGELAVELIVKLIEQLGVSGEGALEDLGLLFGGGPVLGFDGFG